MNRDNFIVRMHLEEVDRFKQREAWGQLDDSDRDSLLHRVAGLPSQLEVDDIESRLFDLRVLRMQLAHAVGDAAAFEGRRKRVVEIARLLEEKAAIPAVAAQLEYLQAMQENEFWEGVDLLWLEEMRLRLRGLVPLLDKRRRNLVYTDFQDEILEVREPQVIAIPRMTSVQYEKKVREYLQSHKDHLVIHRLRANQPLTPANLQELEVTLAEIGAEDGQELLAGLLERNDAPSLAYFVRRLVGMDRQAAHAAFSHFLSDRSLTPPQIRFVEMVIDQLTARGVMDESALYEAPFSDLHAGGPEELFSGHENVIEGIFNELKAIRSELEERAG